MAMPTVNSVGAVVSNTTAITVDPGASHAVDDIDILLIETGVSTPITLATANGFAELTAVSQQTTGAGATGTIMSVFWRRWNGTDGSPVTGTPSNHAVGRMISISGCKTTGDPWNTTATGTTDSSADTSVSIAGGTTSVGACLILAMVAQSLPDATSTTEFSNWANADLANVTEQIDDTSQFGNGGAIGLATGEKAIAGIFGATTADAATSSTRVCAMVALEGAGFAPQALTGTLFTKAPTFFTGTITTGPVTVTGTLFVKAPTFPTGVVTATRALTGILFQKAPTFPQGVVTSGATTLSGVLFTKAPTFPQGVITTGAVSLTGVLFTKAPTFFTGTVTAGTVTPTGSLFQKAPTFPTGLIGQAGTLFGTLFVKAPTFFTGTLAQGGPSFWTPNPAGYIAVTRYGPSPWGAELSGQRFEKAPTFPVGTVT